MKFLHSVDFLGPELNFKIQKHRLFRTRFGGLASLFLIGIAILAFLGFGQDIFEKKQPRVTFNRITEPSGVQLKYLTDKNFLFSIYDQYTDKPIPEFNRRFQVYYDFLDFRGEGMIDTNFNNKFDRCAEEVLNSYTDYLNLIPSSYYCLPQGTQVELVGKMSQGKSTMARLQLDFCKNNTDASKGKIKTDCYTKKETQEFLASKRIQMHYILESSIIDTLNYTDPGFRYVYSNSINTNAFTWTRLNILFKKILVDTDGGFFSQDKKSWDVMALESVISESIYSPNTDTVFSFLIGNSPWEEIYTRSYIKIQDIFAMMGGFLNASLIILKFFVEYSARPRLVEMFNKLYKYEVNDSLKPMKDNTRKDIASSTMIKNNNFIENSELKDHNKDNNKLNFSHNDLTIMINKLNHSENSVFEFNNENIVKILKKNKHRNYSLRMSYFKKVFRCFISAKKDNHIKFYNMVEQKLNKIISCEHFIKLSKHMKIFKKVFFDESQGEILSLCQVPKKKENLDLKLENISEYLVNGMNEEKVSLTNYSPKINTKLTDILLAKKTVI